MLLGTHIDTFISMCSETQGTTGFSPTIQATILKWNLDGIYPISL